MLVHSARLEMAASCKSLTGPKLEGTRPTVPRAFMAASPTSPEIHYVPQRFQGRTEPQLTYNENLVKFEMWFLSDVSEQTDKQANRETDSRQDSIGSQESR